MSLTSYRAAPPRVIHFNICDQTALLQQVPQKRSSDDNTATPAMATQHKTKPTVKPPQRRFHSSVHIALTLAKAAINI